MFFLCGKESPLFPDFFEAPFLGMASYERCPVLVRAYKGTIYMLMNHGHGFYCTTLDEGLNDPAWKNSPDGMRSWGTTHYCSGDTPYIAFQRKTTGS